MSPQMMEAKSPKQVQAELVQQENKLETLRTEVGRLEKTQTELQSQIDQKTADYQIFLSQREADSKRMRADVLAERDQLIKDKQEFQAILVAFQTEKAAFLQSKSSAEKESAQYRQKMDDIKQFVQAIQRAMNLLDFR